LGLKVLVVVVVVERRSLGLHETNNKARYF
jgi:hypothetical protein